MSRLKSSLVPKLWTCFQEGYSWTLFRSDLVAGVVVGIVALPLAIAFAIASGVRPEQGLATGIVAGFLISLLGGSRFQIGGPTGAFVVIVYGIVSKYGMEGLAVASLLAGVLLIVMALLRVGSFIKFIPFPVTVGFTSGIAVLIATTQVRDVLGLTLPMWPVHALEQWALLGRSISGFNGYALATGAVALFFMVVWPRWVKRVPGSLMALIVPAVLVTFAGWPVETVGSRFGVISGHLPWPHWPVIRFEMIREMMGPAVTVAILAGVESLLSAVVADGMTGRRHRSNAEILAQGVANIVSPLFGGIPATGAVARTATNVKNGAQTPVAGLIHALTLWGILVGFGRWAALIPLPALAAVLLVVAYHMSEWRLFAKLFRCPPGDIAVLLVSFLGTVLVDLTVAIQWGILLAALLFMHRMAEVTQAGFLSSSLKEDEESNDRLPAPEGVEVFEIFGPFFFAVVDNFKTSLQFIEKKPRAFVLHMRHVLSLDASALKALEDVFEKFRREGVLFIIAGVHAQPLVALERSGLLDRIGEDNVTPDLPAAFARARAVERPPQLLTDRGAKPH